MDPMTVSIIVDRPREQVFDYLQDIANHAEFNDHYLVDWRLTRIDSVGRGAGARFRIKAPGTRFAWSDVTFVEVERPHRIVEAGRTGKENRVRTRGIYELASASAGTTRAPFSRATRAVASDEASSATITSYSRPAFRAEACRARSVLPSNQASL